MKKILRLSSIPNKYRRIIYDKKNENIQHLSFDALRNYLFSLFMNEYDQYSYYLHQWGNYDVIEIIGDDEVLQRKWAEENNLPANCNLETIIETQIAHYKPDIIADYSHYFMHHNAVDYKKRFSIAKIIAWDGYAASDFKSQSQGVDLVLTCVDYIKEIYQKLGFKCELLPFAFDQRIYNTLKNNLNQKYELTFSGSLAQVHNDRKILLKKLCQSDIPVHLAIDNIGTKNEWISRAQLRTLANFRWSDFIDYSFLQKFNSGGKFGLEMYALMGQSRITLNSHGDSVKQAGNMRLFEATGMGSLLLTDYKPNMSDYFEEGKEVITYKSHADAIDKATYFINHPKEASAIAKNGQSRVFSQYNTENRIRLFEQFCDDLF